MKTWLKNLWWLLIILLMGCTVTDLTTEKWHIHRVSFLQRMEIPEVTIETNGTAILKGYKSDGGSDVAAAVTRAAVSEALKSAKP